jgi:hypothetical protein
MPGGFNDDFNEGDEEILAADRRDSAIRARLASRSPC